MKITLIRSKLEQAEGVWSSHKKKQSWKEYREQKLNQIEQHPTDNKGRKTRKRKPNQNILKGKSPGESR